VQSQAALCALRLVSSAFCELATPLTFCILRISMTEKGMDSLACIENSKSLSKMVQDLTLLKVDNILGTLKNHRNLGTL
jgi:hypothetical protein